MAASPDIRYVVLQPDGGIVEYDGPLTIKDAMARVGGVFTALTPPVPGVMVLAHEDAQREGAAHNWLASTWLRHTLHPNDSIYGNVLVAGVDTKGAPTHLSAEVQAALEALHR